MPDKLKDIEASAAELAAEVNNHCGFNSVIPPAMQFGGDTTREKVKTLRDIGGLCPSCFHRRVALANYRALFGLRRVRPSNEPGAGTKATRRVIRDLSFGVTRCCGFKTELPKKLLFNSLFQTEPVVIRHIHQICQRCFHSRLIIRHLTFSGDWDPNVATLQGQGYYE
ncbi:MAG: hypothetical protein ACK4S4_09375 [Pyrinomonadaceae bacterium]